jgi:hypothetical protein
MTETLTKGAIDAVEQGAANQTGAHINKNAYAEAKDFLPIKGIDYVEFWVGNARQAAHFYRTAFGFRLAAYRGPETGTRDRSSYVLEQGKMRSEDAPGTTQGAINEACRGKGPLCNGGPHRTLA